MVLVASCGGHGSTTLRVLAASSLTEAFEDLARDFEAGNPGVVVTLDFGGSQRLRSQLEFGAEADVFASADHLQMDQAVAAGLTLEVADFASNTSVIIAMPESQVGGLSDLALPEIDLVLAHENVPSGAYSRQTLKKLSEDSSLGLGRDFEIDVLANLVSEEPNVRLVAQKVALGEVDAGIVYQTDIQVAQAVGEVRVIPIPPSANVVARYPIAVLRDAPEMVLAQAFVQFILSEAGQRILSNHGFGSP